MLFSLYAQLGIALFGGKIRRDEWSGAHAAELSQVNQDYALCNFNDFPSAILTLFTLFIVNNWYVIMDVAVAVTSPRVSSAVPCTNCAFGSGEGCQSRRGRVARGDGERGTEARERRTRDATWT